MPMSEWQRKKDDPIWRAKRSASQKAWRQRHPARAIQDRAKAKIHLEQELVRASRARAKDRGLAHTITTADIHIPDVCPVLGIPLFKGGGKISDNSPSLDRVNQLGGYTPDNVRVISYRANRAKSNLTLDEVRALVRYMEAE